MTAAIPAALAFGALLTLWLSGGGEVDLPWAPTLDLRLHFRLDALGALYSLLATGAGAAVLLFSGRFMRAHLERRGRPRAETVRFHALLLLFMGSMVGLATAQDLVLLFVFWDLTAVASYLLIAFDREEATARWAALMALLVTGISAVALLIGIVVLQHAYGTFSLPEILERAESGRTVAVAGVLIAVAALAKSAQVPFHFWLPRAMAAPTPVSAYLHSAAMVAAGVLLLGRTYPLLQLSPGLLDGLIAVGLTSIVIGGLLALTRDDLKQVLACSTFSQYGYVVLLYGLGGPYGAGGAALYVVGHGLAKCALFLTAGAVGEATGVTRLSEAGGLGRRMPWIAAGSLAAAATVGALPLTVGFFGDEALFTAALERGWPFAVATVLAAGLTLAYLTRLWTGVFLGPGHVRTSVAALPWQLVAPIVGLGAACVAGGLVIAPLRELAEDAGAVSLAAPATMDVAYHLDLRSENLMALASFALGGLGFAAPALLRRAGLALAAAGERLGPERLYGAALRGLNGLSDAIHDREVRDLRARVAAVLVPGALLLILGFLSTPTQGFYIAGPLDGDDVPLAVVLGFVAVGAVAATAPRGHFTLVLAVSVVGFMLAVAYALFGAPNVTLVAVLVETLFALLFVGVLSQLPRDALERRAARDRASRETGDSRRWRDPLVAVVAGASAGVVVWGALSRPTEGSDVAVEQTRLAPEAHADNVVTAILADFRALDTLVEMSVIAVALLGVVSILRRGSFA